MELLQFYYFNLNEFILVACTAFVDTVETLLSQIFWFSFFSSFFLSEHGISILTSIFSLGWDQFIRWQHLAKEAVSQLKPGF